MKTGYVISDLHLFTNRTCAKERMTEIYRLAQAADLLVLNGDTVDFRWSMSASSENTITAAVAWINNLMEYSHGCTVYYIMGNHDANKQLANALTSIQQQDRRFRWSSSYLQCEDMLFFHGDCIKNGGVIHIRQLPLTQKMLRMPLLHWLYKMAVELRLHRIPVAADRSITTIKKIDALIENDTSPSRFTGVRKVYFGHTHAAFSEVSFNNRTYFNTGSMIRHLRFLPQMFTFSQFPA